MVLLKPAPINIINKIELSKKTYFSHLTLSMTGEGAINNCYIYLYKVNKTEKIICFLNLKNVLLILLWKNEYDTTPHEQLVELNFNKRYEQSFTTIINILIIQQLDQYNFMIKKPLSSNRYVYSLNTFLFKEYDILTGRVYDLEANEKTELVYYTPLDI
jgi:hypothetical protein